MREYEPEIISLENPDREENGSNRRSHRRELLIGLFLVLAVVGWGGLDWWIGGQKLASYRAGQQAAAAQRWEQALDSYVSAGDYADAEARAKDAARYIAERDKQYGLAKSWSDAGNWAAALVAIRVVTQIQHDYRDSQSLTSRAEAGVNAGALGGTVALRPDADPPGLYYHGASGWIWLEGSDLISTRHNANSDRYYVYDAPKPGVDPVVTFDPNPKYDRDAASKRRFIVARLDTDSVSYTPLDFDLKFQQAALWGEAGGWGMVSLARNCGYAVGIWLALYCGDFVYQGADSTAAVPVRVANPDWLILDLAPDGSKTLLADISGQVFSKTQFSLYVADADGSNPKLLHQGAGFLSNAVFSDDSRYVLLRQSAWLINGNAVAKVVLLDTSGNEAPLELAASSTSDIDSLMFADHLLVIETSGKSIVLSLVDLAGSKERKVIWSGEQQLASDVAVTQLEDKGTLICINSGGATITSVPSSRTCLLVDQSGAVMEVQIPLNPNENLLGAWYVADRVLYKVQLYKQSIDNPDKYDLITHLRSLSPQRGATWEEKELLTLSKADESLSLGPTMIAYSGDDGLHALTYDGSIDLPLDQSVTSLDNLAQFASRSGN